MKIEVRALQTVPSWVSSSDECEHIPGFSPKQHLSSSGKLRKDGFDWLMEDTGSHLNFPLDREIVVRVLRSCLFSPGLVCISILFWCVGSSISCVDTDLVFAMSDIYIKYLTAIHVW